MRPGASGSDFAHRSPMTAHYSPSRACASKPMRIAWEGDFEGLHSLAMVNRAVCQELIGRGHDVGLLPRGLEADSEASERFALDLRLAARLGRAPEGGHAQVHVRHCWPPRPERPEHGRWVLMQPWEFGSMPKNWLPMLQCVDEIWAYSRYVRDCYLEAEVPRERVRDIPLGVDPELFRPGLEPLALPPGPQIRFLFVGGTIFRKGIDLLLKAFADAFRAGDGIGLVVKEMGSKSFYRGQTAEKEIGELREQGYPVEYIERDLMDSEMAGLYAACDCLVHPFRGEGFGLPIVEAMACGLPVIVTGAGPVLDYASDETAYLIPASRAQFAEYRVGEIETLGRPWLFEPDVDALVELLKRVASDRAEARAKGTAASAHIREHFTWGRTVDAVERRLVALAGPEVGQPFQGDRRSKDLACVGDRVGLESPTYTKPRSPLRLRARSQGQPTVSLTMIVRDEEENLPRCLSSVNELFDEIVVVDTGSKDRTAEIAEEFGARVFDFVWVDDFAAARNAALARATGDYAFWLDADDVIDPPQRGAWRSSSRGSNPASRSPTWSSAPAIQGRTGLAAIRSWIISGCFRSEKMCAGVSGCTNRSCRRSSGRTCRFAGPTSPCAIRDTPIAHSGCGSSIAIPRSCGKSWPSGPMIRLCCSTWARSLSSDRTGRRRSTISTTVWPARGRRIRSRVSFMP